MAEEIRDFNATVFVVFISAAHFENLAHQLSDLNVTGKVWIASEAWATSNTIRQVDGKLFLFRIPGVADINESKFFFFY